MFGFEAGCWLNVKREKVIRILKAISIATLLWSVSSNYHGDTLRAGLEASHKRAEMNDSLCSSKYTSVNPWNLKYQINIDFLLWIWRS